MEVIQLVIKKNGHFPNNETLPVLHYQDVLKLSGNAEHNEKIITGIFQTHSWNNSWVDGIYDYHHYHSNTHEVLGILSGSCSVMLGGDKGIRYNLSKGDVLIIPAGVSHKKISASEDFECVGAYPGDTMYDLKYGLPDELEEAEETISKVPTPETDPVYGLKGPLFDYWKISRNINI